MKVRLLGLITHLSLALFTLGGSAQACELTGRFTVAGHWASFRKWHLEFSNDQLIHTWTDDLSEREWNGFSDIHPGGPAVFSASSQAIASDAYLGYVIFLRKICVTNGGQPTTFLEVTGGYESYAPFSGLPEEGFSHVTEGLAIIGN